MLLVYRNHFSRSSHMRLFFVAYTACWGLAFLGAPIMFYLDLHERLPKWGLATYAIGLFVTCPIILLGIASAWTALRERAGYR